MHLHWAKTPLKFSIDIMDKESLLNLYIYIKLISCQFLINYSNLRSVIGSDILAKLKRIRWTMKFVDSQHFIHEPLYSKCIFFIDLKEFNLFSLIQKF